VTVFTTVFGTAVGAAGAVTVFTTVFTTVVTTGGGGGAVTVTTTVDGVTSDVDVAVGVPAESDPPAAPMAMPRISAPTALQIAKRRLTVGLLGAGGGPEGGGGGGGGD
jgi:hypothetical protein